MPEQESPLKRFRRLFLRCLPLLGMAGALLWLWLSGETLSVDTVLSYTPELPLLAALFLLLWTVSVVQKLALIILTIDN